MLTPPVNAKAQAISGEQQLRQFGQFLDAHDRLLGSLNADDKRTGFFRTAAQCAPVTLAVEQTEQLTHHQLANTNNTVLNKIVCVFAELCEEVQRLRNCAERLQLRFLFVDESLLGDGDDERVWTTDEEGHRLQQQQQLLIVRISEQLEFVCEIQYLVQRCIVVGADMLRQLGAFFGSEFVAVR